MFTGLVEAMGRITRVAQTAAGRELRVACAFDGLEDGESIAVNGACLTVREHGRDQDGPWFTTAAVDTTLARTTIGRWHEGQAVNLERALRLGDRLGGHLVLGHVDALGTVVATADTADAWLVDLDLPAALVPLMVDKGSLAVDGVSLTVNALRPAGVQLSIIEYTRRHTTLGALRPGDAVHVEADMLAKHVARLLEPRMGGMLPADLPGRAA
jgi:riboflavin synthase